MARNPWLTISPLTNVAGTPDGYSLVFGGFGKVVSWLWMVGGILLMVRGYFILWLHGALERLIGNLAIVIIISNWILTLISIGDHRFRMPIMGLSLLLQSIGAKSLFLQKYNR
jgi:hypothetical protein